MKTSTYETSTHDVTLQDGTDLTLELPVKPSFIMDYKEPLFREDGQYLYLGYLADDSDCANPLEDCDGMGHIYEARRHGSTLEQYEAARGYSRTWGGPNLDLVDHDKLVVEGQRRILADIDLTDKALHHCRLYWSQDVDESDKDFILNCLDTENELTPVIDLDDIRLDLWKAGRADGTIGDRHAVLLDVFEHGQVSYSVSGQGMQCDFDTARGAAIWVPDDCARDELLRRAAVYIKGDVNEHKLRSKTQYGVRTLSEDGLAYDDAVHPVFDEWFKAFAYLETLAVAPRRSQYDAEMVAARELAEQACTVYTDWRNGNCFCVVVATYDRDGDEIDYDTCGGFIGDDEAYAALKLDYFPQPETEGA